MELCCVAGRRAGGNVDGAVGVEFHSGEDREVNAHCFEKRRTVRHVRDEGYVALIVVRYVDLGDYGSVRRVRPGMGCVNPRVGGARCVGARHRERGSDPSDAEKNHQAKKTSNTHP